MTRTYQALGVFALAVAGLWGCTASNSSTADKARQLEVRVAKMEEDLKATTASRDVLKSRLVALEDQVRAESERAKLIGIERDQLTANLKAKSDEKEVAVAHYDDLVKKLEGVLGHAKVAQAKVREVQVPAVVISRVRE